MASSLTQLAIRSDWTIMLSMCTSKMLSPPLEVSSLHRVLADPSFIITQKFWRLLIKYCVPFRVVQSTQSLPGNWQKCIGKHRIGGLILNTCFLASMKMLKGHSVFSARNVLVY